MENPDKKIPNSIVLSEFGIFIEILRLPVFTFRLILFKSIFGFLLIVYSS